MSRILVASTDVQLNHKIRALIDIHGSEFVPHFLHKKEDIVEYLNYELPELVIYNLSDTNLDNFSIIKEVKKDPWLLYGGIIALYKDKINTEIDETLKSLNCISTISNSDFSFSFPRLLRILEKNNKILFHRTMQNKIVININNKFTLENDPFDVKTYSHLVANHLYNLNYISNEQKEKLLVALMELLMNAIEHGSCQISYQEKSNWLNSHGDIFELIRRKSQDPAIKNKRVQFTYRITNDRSLFKITDEGMGFDWSQRIQKGDTKPNLAKHGHGIKITNAYINNLKYNKKGNTVYFEMLHQKEESSLLPIVLKNRLSKMYNDGDVVFKENEESNSIYYIVSGKFNIYSQNKLLSTLTPEDIFLGEMSFLRNNKRSATVRSVGDSVLIEISKSEFIQIVKTNPHYTIFIAKLIASRITNLNEYSSKLQSV